MPLVMAIFVVKHEAESKMEKEYGAVLTTFWDIEVRSFEVSVTHPAPTRVS